MSEELPLAVAIVLERSVIIFGGVEQTKLPEQSANMIRALSAEVEALRSAAQAYVDAWEAGTGTVYLIDQFRALLNKEPAR